MPEAKPMHFDWTQIIVSLFTMLGAGALVKWYDYRKHRDKLAAQDRGHVWREVAWLKDQLIADREKYTEKISKLETQVEALRKAKHDVANELQTVRLENLQQKHQMDELHGENLLLKEEVNELYVSAGKQPKYANLPSNSRSA